MPPFFAGRDPPYLIVAGLVFTAACDPYLRSEYGDEFDADVPVKILDQMLFGLAEVPGEQVVVLSQVLAAGCTVGYDGLSNYQVVTFNGERVRSLEGLAKALGACEGPFLRFGLDNGETVVLDREEASELRGPRSKPLFCRTAHVAECFESFVCCIIHGAGEGGDAGDSGGALHPGGGVAGPAAGVPGVLR